MPKVRRVLETALYCDRLEHTADFYGELLGIAPFLATQRLVAFDAGQATILLLFQRGATQAPFSTPGGVLPPHDGSPQGHLAFAVDTADLAAWEDRLLSMGVRIESRVSWERGGQSLYFRDPDGRSVELATPGVWPAY